MATRVNTRIGDIFEVAISKSHVRYFQLIAFDLLQLNSDVIRCFEGIYARDESPSIDELVSSKIDFYAHCVTKFGIKMKLWAKFGHSETIGDLNKIIFRDTNDYGIKEGEKPVSISHNWHIWRLGDENFTKIDEITEDLRASNIGLVYNPLSIVDMIMGKRMPPLYPNFE